MSVRVSRASGPRHGLPSFWLLHAGGWLAYGLAMTLSRIGMFPLRYMVVSKGLLMVLGFVISLGLRRNDRVLHPCHKVLKRIPG